MAPSASSSYWNWAGPTKVSVRSATRPSYRLPSSENGPLLLKKDDPEPVGGGVEEPVVNASLGRFVAERRLVLLN
jgi:hypothetical protein